MSEYPFEPIGDIDITEQTAPTLDVVNDMLNQVAKPSLELLEELLNSSHPFTSKVLRFLYKKRIEKLNRKYFGGAKTGENFKRFKSYRLLLYRKRSLANVCRPDLAEPCVGTVGFDSGKRSDLEQ